MRLLAAILALVLLAIASAHAEKRVALVIGNAAYRNVTPLLNPRNNANDIAASLKRLVVRRSGPLSSTTRVTTWRSAERTD
jgi:hypothetical protein